MSFLYLLFSLSFLQANTCTNKIVTDPMVAAVLNDPTFQDALRIYEETSHKIVVAQTGFQQQIDDLKVKISTTEASIANMTSASLISSEKEATEIYQADIEDISAKMQETLHPLLRRQKMAEGILAYYEFILTEAGFGVYFLKTFEQWFDPSNPEAAEGRLFTEVEESQKKKAVRARLYITGKNNKFIEKSKEASDIVVSHNVVAVTYSTSFSDFIGLSFPEVVSIGAKPSVMQVSISYAPGSYISSELIARDFVKVCP